MVGTRTRGADAAERGGREERVHDAVIVRYAAAVGPVRERAEPLGVLVVPVRTLRSTAGLEVVDRFGDVVIGIHRQNGTKDLRVFDLCCFGGSCR